MKVLIIFMAFLSVLNDSKGHEGKEHPSVESAGLTVGMPDSYSRINDHYVKNIRPIFKKSCFDCHSQRSVFPWYYQLPGVKQMIDHDIKEAREHLDFSNDFPFIGHGTPLKDLESIAESILKEKMPPPKYLWFRDKAKLTSKERTAVIEWVRESLEAMK